MKLPIAITQKTLDKNNVHKIYHDTQYGYALDSDNELFGRLILEINQAGCHGIPF